MASPADARGLAPPHAVESKVVHELKSRDVVRISTDISTDELISVGVELISDIRRSRVGTLN
eukprot:scaffold6111_cov107-Isochrysis_galbana.AAC.6